MINNTGAERGTGKPVTASRSPPSHSGDFLDSPPSPASHSHPPPSNPHELLARKSCDVIPPLLGPTAAAVSLGGDTCESAFLAFYNKLHIRLQAERIRPTRLPDGRSRCRRPSHMWCSIRWFRASDDLFTSNNQHGTRTGQLAPWQFS